MMTVFTLQVDEEPDPVSLGVCGVGQPPQGLKRKAETPLGSPPEPGQVLQQQDDDTRTGRFKIRVRGGGLLPGNHHLIKPMLN